MFQDNLFRELVVDNFAGGGDRVAARHCNNDNTQRSYRRELP